MLLKRIVRGLRVGQFALAVGIFTYAALMPASVIKPQQPLVLHVAGNILLFLSAWLAGYGRVRPWTMLLLLIPYSLLIELAQWAAPSRTVDARDMLANIVGLTAGLPLAIAAEWVLQRQPALRAWLLRED